jgi:hypothetical protein
MRQHHSASPNRADGGVYALQGMKLIDLVTWESLLGGGDLDWDVGLGTFTAHLGRDADEERQHLKRRIVLGEGSLQWEAALVVLCPNCAGPFLDQHLDRGFCCPTLDGVVQHRVAVVV